MRRALARALLHVPSGGRALDVPCGTGQYSWYLAAAGFRTAAADIAPEMLKVAATLRRMATKNAPEFVAGNIFHLSFPTRSFDAAVCIRLFNLLDRAERIAALRELARVADTVIASYSHQYTLKHFCRLVRYRLRLRVQPKPRLSRDRLEDELSQAGLELRQLIPVCPLLSEVWLAVLVKPQAL